MPRGSCARLAAAGTIPCTVLTEAAVRELLVPFELELSPRQLGQLLTYLELLFRWNRRINLTAIRDPNDCVRRHFGESLWLGSWMRLSGRLLDIGSGAGFPGLALKIVFPEVAVTLLEPIAKKRAFLKEVARACSMGHVEVRGGRLEDFVRTAATLGYDAGTSRAVGKLHELVPLAARCLKPSGKLILWLSHQQGVELDKASFEWDPPKPIPLSRHTEIRVGVRKSW